MGEQIPRAFLIGGDGPAREQSKLGIGAYRQGLLPASIGIQMEFALSQGSTGCEGFQ